MLTEREGTAEAIRKLLASTLIPAIESEPKAWLAVLAEDAASPGIVPAAARALERHDFPEICICLSGSAEIWAGSKSHRIERGQILAIPTGVPHSTGTLHAIHAPPGSISSRLMWIGSFPYGAVLNLCESVHGVHRSTSRQLFLERHINSYIQDLVLELKNGDYHYQALVRCSLLQVLTRIYRGMSVSAAEDEFHSAGPPEPAAAEEGLVGRAKKYLQAHFDSPIDLETVAGAMFASKSHLCREFKRDTGMTVMDYLARIRIDAGKRLLMTSLKVSAIAHLVGFDDPYYFSRLFRKLTSLSPSEFRAREQHDVVGSG